MKRLVAVFMALISVLILSVCALSLLGCGEKDLPSTDDLPIVLPDGEDEEGSGQGGGSSGGTGSGGKEDVIDGGRDPIGGFPR